MLALWRLPPKEKTHQEPGITDTAHGECVCRDRRIELRSAGRVANRTTKVVQVEATNQCVGCANLVRTTRNTTTNQSAWWKRHDECFQKQQQVTSKMIN